MPDDGFRESKKVMALTLSLLLCLILFSHLKQFFKASGIRRRLHSFSSLMLEAYEEVIREFLNQWELKVTI